MFRFCLIVAISLQISSVTLADPPQRRPNVLFIAIDDQNDWIGCLDGHPLAKTPHLDDLAKSGTLFLNAHCQSPLCNPSRTSLMTGLRPDRTGIYGLEPLFHNLPEYEQAVTIPQAFAAAGYKTLAAGKLFHNGFGRGGENADFHVRGPAGGIGVGPAQKLVTTPNPHPLVDWGVFPHRDEQKGDYKIASWAVEQLGELPEDHPFFLSLGFFLPHVPCYVTQKWWDLYPNDETLLPRVLLTDRDDTPRFSWALHWKLPEPRQKFLIEADEWKNLCRAYLASTSFVDAQIGRVMAALEQSPHRDNTIVVVWSDHGWHLGEKGITGKNSLWDRSTRVPLIFAGPGITQGQRVTSPAELLDLYPTLLELAEISDHPELDGLSLVAQLKDASAVRTRPAITTHNHDNHGVRTEKWRYIKYADGSEELYDMQSDPREWNNLLAADVVSPELMEVVAELQKEIPTSNEPAAGSAHRILIRAADGTLTWEGEPIDLSGPIPELED